MGVATIAFFIGTYLDTNPPLGESTKYTLSKPFFKKGGLFFVLQFAFVITLLIYARPAEAGLFSDIWKFFSGSGVEKAAESNAATISLPLLGSEARAQSPAGIGGPGGESATPPLPTVQDSALVASRNPAGTLSTEHNGQILIYTVQKGDTPGGIAENFDISLNTLLWANNIRNANLIKIGDELIILPVTGIQYEVKKGDTIGSVAKKFKGDENEILNFNGLAIGEPLKIGMTLIIPDGEITPISTSPVTTSVSRFANLPAERTGYYLRPIMGGRKSQGIHGFNGVDLATSCGSAVLASAEGSIIIARSSGWNGGYGKYTVLAHPNGTQTLYAHLGSILASVGQFVSQGSQIATVGSTGNSTGCHAHFEVRGARNPF